MFSGHWYSSNSSAVSTCVRPGKSYMYCYSFRCGGDHNNIIIYYRTRCKAVYNSKRQSVYNCNLNCNCNLTDMPESAVIAIIVMVKCYIILLSQHTHRIKSMFEPLRMYTRLVYTPQDNVSQSTPPHSFPLHSRKLRVRDLW